MARQRVEFPEAVKRRVAEEHENLHAMLHQSLSAFMSGVKVALGVPADYGADLDAGEFVPPMRLAIKCVGSGRVECDPPGPYAEGQQVILAAVRAKGGRFVRWEGDLSGEELRAQVTMDDDHEVAAVFERLDPDAPRESLPREGRRSAS